MRIECGDNLEFMKSIEEILMKIEKEKEEKYLKESKYLADALEIQKKQNLFMERKIRSLIRWNALVMVLRANKSDDDFIYATIGDDDYDIELSMLSKKRERNYFIS